MSEFVSYHAPTLRRDEHCTRCGARLSRYGSYAVLLCAPCDALLHPWQPSPFETRKLDECPICGGFKQRVSLRCRACANQKKRLDFRGHKPL